MAGPVECDPGGRRTILEAGPVHSGLLRYTLWLVRCTFGCDPGGGSQQQRNVTPEVLSVVPVAGPVHSDPGGFHLTQLTVEVHKFLETALAPRGTGAYVPPS